MPTALTDHGPTAAVVGGDYVNPGMIDLGTTGADLALAVGINESGSIVLWSRTLPPNSGTRLHVGDPNAGFTDIGLSPGGTGFFPAFGGSSSRGTITDAGMVVGRQFFDPSRPRAFTWSEGTGLLDLGTLPVIPGTIASIFSGASAANNAGDVVGISAFGPEDDNIRRAFRWNATTGMVNLGSLPVTSPGRDESFASAINAHGVVVGGAYTTLDDGVTVAVRAARWLPDNTLEMLVPLFPEAKQSIANDINDAGQITGRSWASPTREHAFIWDETNGMVDLGSLVDNHSRGRFINDAGHVAGTDGRQAFYWSPETDMVPLQFPGAFQTEPLDMNNRDQIVGRAASQDRVPRAFLWTPQDGFRNLGFLSLAPERIATTAYAINDRGDIVGQSVGDDGMGHGFLIRGAAAQLAVEDAVDLVLALDLPKGRKNSLLTSLTKALEKIAAGEPGAAGMISAFINKVEAQRGKSIPDADADALVALAQRVLDELH
jgi:probable HAF family extracellular repeat protein